jgi:hypothetical protein
MSLASWKAEFYPVPASEIKTVREAIEHGLRKWKGLRPGELKAHGLVLSGAVLQSPGDVEEPSVPITSSSCALCHLCADKRGSVHCHPCILTEIRGRACDRAIGATESRSPYANFLENGDPEPMIALLEQALERVKP